MLRVRYGHDARACLSCAEPSNQLCFQAVEGNRSLKRRAGFRNDHDGETAARKPVQELLQLARTEAVAGEEDVGQAVGCGAGRHVGKEFQARSSPQIGASDTCLLYTSDAADD